MAWFSYSILSLIKLYLVLALSGLGGENATSRVKRVDGITKFEKHWSKLSSIVERTQTIAEIFSSVMDNSLVFSKLLSSLNF